MRWTVMIALFLFMGFSIQAQGEGKGGKKLYDGACAACHGVEGDGQGAGAKGLNPLPKDFTTGWYKFRSTPHGQMPTDEDIARTIFRGIPRTAMPAFETILSEDEVMNVVQYIKTFTDRFERWGPGDPIDIPNDIPQSSDTVLEGKHIYSALKCWDCHGADGTGDGPISSKLKDDMDNPIEAFDFTIGKFKGGDTNEDVYRTINTGLSGTPMGSFLNAFLFSKDDYQDLTSYKDYLSEKQLNEFLSYVSTLPGKTEIEGLSEEDREILVNRRRWALVHYVKSLTAEKGVFSRWFHSLFVEDMEVTR